MVNLIRNSVLLAAAVVLSACETVTPTVDAGASADQLSYDGLSPLKNVRVDKAWARPDLDLTGYDKFMLQGAGIHYRPVKASGRYSSSATEFPIDARQRQRLEKELREAFLDELTNSEKIVLATRPGPNVLLVTGALLDVVSHVPPEPQGRGGVYISSIGDLTLVIELVDSESGTVLVRALDRRAAEPMGRMQESNRVTNQAEVRRLARSWARLLRSRLEEIVDNIGIAAAK